MASRPQSRQRTEDIKKTGIAYYVNDPRYIERLTAERIDEYLYVQNLACIQVTQYRNSPINKGLLYLSAK